DFPHLKSCSVCYTVQKFPGTSQWILKAGCQNHFLHCCTFPGIPHQSLSAIRHSKCPDISRQYTGSFGNILVFYNASSCSAFCRKYFNKKSNTPSTGLQRKKYILFVVCLSGHYNSLTGKQALVFS